MIRRTATARQPRRQAWTVDELVHQRAIALGLSTDNSSSATYDPALDSYLTFCALHHFPIDPTVDTLSFFTVYMSHYISHRSVVSYLSSIVNKLEPFYPEVQRNRASPLVERTLSGCKRLQGQTINRKAPLSRAHLRLAADTLSPRSSLDDVLFVVLLFTGFHALMRLGELTTSDTKGERQLDKFSRRDSAISSEKEFSFVLPTHKADALFEGIKIVVSSVTIIDCPGLFAHYLKLRDKRHPFNPYLWVTEDGDYPTRNWFLRRMKALVPESHFSGYSLRAGGAMALAEDGTAPCHIQAMGRWSSDTFQTYVRKNPMVLQALLHRYSTP